MATKGSFYANNAAIGEEVQIDISAAEAAAAAAAASAAQAEAAKETSFGLGIAIPGAALVTSEWLFGHTFDVAVNFALNLAGSVAKSDTAATGSPVLSIRKNGVQFATLTYTGTVGVFAGAATSFAIGDKLTLIAPVSPDATLALLSITLFATR